MMDRGPADRRPASRQGVLRAFEEHFGRAAEVVARAPGRVNLLGAHVDTSEGWVLPAAIDRAVWLAAAPNERGTSCELRAVALDLGFEETLHLDHLPEPRLVRGGEASWLDLPAGVAWALEQEGFRAPGMDVVFSSDLPMGAGVSSSAAVEMAFLLAWEALAERRGELWHLDGSRKAILGRRAENDYLGVQSGVMDQFASLHGAVGQAIFLDCRTLEYRHVPLPESIVVLVVDSGVRRRLSASAFNDRRAECGQALDILRLHLPALTSLRDLDFHNLELLEHRLPIDLRRRVRHVVEECARAREGARVLEAGDLETFGALMCASHRSSRDLYEVSIPELDVLAAAAWGAEGCHGARLSGGGFGGCVTALVEAESVESVAASIRSMFGQHFGGVPDLWVGRITEGAKVFSASCESH